MPIDRVNLGAPIATAAPLVCANVMAIALPLDRIQVIAIALSGVFLVVVLELVRRRRLVEEYAFVWIGVSLAMLAISIWRELLHAAARELGVHDPPNVLLIALTAAVVIALLVMSVILSRQRRQIERLIEDTAILTAEVRELKKER